MRNAPAFNIMIVKETIVPSRGSRVKRVLLLRCDVCAGEFERKYSVGEKTKLHFCSRGCMYEAKRKDGPVYEKRKATFEAKYGKGITCTFQAQEVKDKSKKTNLKKYGAEYPIQSQAVKDKRRASDLEKYGVEFASQSKSAIEKRKKTNLKKYGVEQALSSAEVRNKAKKTNLEKYGNENPTATRAVREKIEKTNLARYGVRNPFNQKEVKKNANSALAIEKRHETMKKNGTYGKSKAEDRFYDFLCTHFDHTSIERQARINGWNIDFKISEAYIQFDGVYWHGLDRPLQEVKSSKDPRDKVIYGTYLRDQEQNIWFKENNITFVRVTDKEFEHSPLVAYNRLKEILYNGKKKKEDSRDQV